MTEEIMGESPDLREVRVLQVIDEKTRVRLWIRPPVDDPDSYEGGWEIVLGREEANRLAELLRPAPPAGSGGPVRIPPGKKKPPPRSNV